MAPAKGVKAVKGNKLQQFTHGSMTIKVGECVLINPDSTSTSLPYIGRIKDAVQTANNPDEITVSVTWYYRPEEASGGRKAFHGEKELFASDHQDWCHKNTIIGKCKVHGLKKYQMLPQVADGDYFSRFTYKPALREFDPDRVPVYCMCEMPYNPDRFMIMCDICEEWYHPECVQLDLTRVERVTNYECPDCRKSHVTDKRHRTGPPPPVPQLNPQLQNNGVSKASV